MAAKDYKQKDPVLFEKKKGERCAKYEVKCLVCGKKEIVNPSRAFRYKTCSKKCMGGYNTSQDMNQECYYCGKMFHLKPYHKNRYDTHTCSKECMVAWKKELMSGDGNHQYGLKGDKNSSWEGGRGLTSYGYVLLREVPEGYSVNAAGCALEHKFVMEKFLGRRLIESEVVHHKNHIKVDNRIENLQIMNRGEHSAYHNKISLERNDEFFHKILSLQEQVLLWNSIAGNDVSNKNLADTYWKLVEEEAKELYTATSPEDILDALVDLGVVGLFFHAVNKKALTEGNSRWLQTSLVRDKEDTKDALLSCIKNKDTTTFITLWLNLFYDYSFYFDVIGAFKDVMECNMSKYATAQQLVDCYYNIFGFIESIDYAEWQKDMIEDAGRYGDVTYSIKEIDGEEFYVFYAKEDLREGVTFKSPKIAKPFTFREPQLSQFILK